ncbi:MAG: secretin N-terminal domain-containing protein [bacterium]
MRSKERPLAHIVYKILYIIMISCIVWIIFPKQDLFAQKEPDSQMEIKGTLPDQEAPPVQILSDTPQTSTEGLISLDLKGVDLVDLLRFLSDQLNCNIIPSVNVKGKVDLYIKKLLPEEAFNVVIETFGLAYAKNNSVIRVMTIQESEPIMLKLQYGNTKQIFDVLNKVKSSVGEVIITEDTGLLLIKDSPSKINLMKNLIEELDQPINTKAFKLTYADVKEVKPKIDGLLSKEFGKAEIDEKTNQLIITDLQKKIWKVAAVVKILDQPMKQVKQVLIEAKIIQILLKDEFDLGVDWEKAFGGAKDNISLKGSFSAVQSLGRFQKIKIGTLDVDHYSAALDFLKTLGDTEIISSPRISAIDGKEASIMVGTREAYSTQTLSQSQVTTTTSENIEYVDVGIKLSVKPTIKEEGYVILDIRPEVSTVINTLVTSLGSSVPIIEKAEAETSISAWDNETIIIAGLIKKEKKEQNNVIPILGKLPVFGWLFGNKSKKNNRTELVIFLTPKIYNNKGSGGDLETLKPAEGSETKDVKQQVQGDGGDQTSEESLIPIDKSPTLRFLKEEKKKDKLKRSKKASRESGEDLLELYLKEDMIEIKPE